MINVSFNHIIIKGFLSIGEAEADFREQGFVSVVGVNNELKESQSNGSGKSSIFDAIMWTLTGETCRGASNVVNEKTDEGCLCELSLTVDSQDYMIRRTKSHPEFGNSTYVYCGDELLSDQTAKSKEIIYKLIPVISSSDVLGSIVLLGQGLPYKFSSLSPIKRKELLEVLSGSSQEIEKVKFQLETEKSKILKEVSDKTFEQGKVIGVNSHLVTVQTELKNQVEMSDQEFSIDQDLTDISTTIVSLEDTVKSLRDPKVFQELEDKINDLRARKSQVQQKIDALRLQRDRVFQADCLIKNGSCPTCGRAYEVSPEDQNKKKIFSDKIKQYDELIAKLQVESTSIDQEVTKTNQRIFKIKEVISQKEYEISRLKSRESELKNLLTQKEVNEEKLKEVTKTIDSNLVKINEISKIIEDNNDTIGCIDYLSRLVSRDFKGYMLQEVIDYVSSRSDYYSKYLFDETVKLVVSLSGNKILISINDRLYENLSGGERQRVDLAVQFALRDMLSVVTGFSCNILVLDEVFDNLDSQGSSSLINLVNSELSDVDSLFIITHHSEIDIPYDKQLLVVKNEKGISSISEKLS